MAPFEMVTGQMHGVNIGHPDNLAAADRVALQVPTAAAGQANRENTPAASDDNTIHGGGTPANGATRKQLAEW